MEWTGNLLLLLFRPVDFKNKKGILGKRRDFMKVTHSEIEAVYNRDSKILILGTIPSPMSRETGFYYGHPQNRFWKIFSDLYRMKLETKEDKVTFLLDNHIALWDVLASCEIDGASDSSIHDIIPNDIKSLLEETSIECIFTAGKKATELYKKYIFPQTRIESIYLPSTSPANCAVEYDTLINEYQKIKEYAS